MVRQAAPRPSWSEPPLGRDPAASRESISANLNTQLEGGGNGVARAEIDSCPTSPRPPTPGRSHQSLLLTHRPLAWETCRFRRLIPHLRPAPQKKRRTAKAFHHPNRRPLSLGPISRGLAHPPRSIRASLHPANYPRQQGSCPSRRMTPTEDR